PVIEVRDHIRSDESGSAGYQQHRPPSCGMFPLGRSAPSFAPVRRPAHHRAGPCPPDAIPTQSGPSDPHMYRLSEQPVRTGQHRPLRVPPALSMSTLAQAAESPILIIPYMWIGDFVRCHSVVKLLKTRFQTRPVDLLT